jgi:hypothetical protein
MNSGTKEALDFAINSVWKRNRRKAKGLIPALFIYELAAEVESDLNWDVIDWEERAYRPEEAGYRRLPQEHMDYVKTELRKRGQRARGIAVF